ncbi:MAG: hypothetical protein KBT06_05535 [Prevotellaceae bacterium]|nr:hypothetical protein [Candidatus Colivivens equi]
MNKIFKDMKCVITIMFTLAIIGLAYITVFSNTALFEKVFVLFSNILTSVFTYYFTRTKETKETKEDNENKE